MRRRSFLTGLGLSLAAAAASRAQGRATIVDTHLHPVRSLRRGGSVGGIIPNVLREMDQFGISHAILMPPPYAEQDPKTYGLAELSSAVRGQPRLAFAAGGESLNPLLHGVTADRVSTDTRRRFTAEAEKIAAAGAAAFGEIAIEHFSSGRGGHPYESVPPDHPLMLALADVAARNGLPIEMHMEAVPQDMAFPPNRPKGPNPPTLRANIAGLERLLAHNRQARIVWAHAGWDLSGMRTPALMQGLLQRHANLFMNIKSDRAGDPVTAPLDGGGRLKPAWLALLRAAPGRFCIGTDQFVSDDATDRLQQARRVVDALPPDLATSVASGNARQIYRLRI